MTPLWLSPAVNNLTVLQLIDIAQTIYFPSLVSLFAASRINWATSFGCDFEKNTSGWYTSRRIGESYSGFKVLVEQRQANVIATNSDNNYDPNDGRILGAHLLGMHEEIINIFALAIKFGLNITDIKNMIFSYPTKSSDIGYMLQKTMEK